MSRNPEIKTLARKTVSLALSRGADAADAYVRAARKLDISWRNGAPETINRSAAMGLGLRVSVDGRSLLVHSTDLDSEALENLADQAVAMARTLPRSSEPTLFADAADLAPPPHPDPELVDEPMDAKTARLARVEKAMLAVKGVTGTAGVGYSESAGTIALANSRGLEMSAPFASLVLSASAIAEAGGESYSGERSARMPARRYLPDLESFGREAGERAAGMMGARSVPSARVPVIFSPDTAWTLLACLSEPLQGDRVVEGRSYLSGRLGERIASDRISIVDDPALPYGPASRAFDGEGTPCRRLTLVENGVLRAFLTDLASAGKLGVAAGGHAGRGSYDSVPQIGGSNFLLEPGTQSKQEIIAATSRGLLVETLSGWWVGRSSVTDTYSSAAMGYWIEDGAIAHPVKGVSIGGNLLEMLAAVDRVGSDLPTWAQSCAPTLRVAEMAVSGT